MRAIRVVFLVGMGGLVAMACRSGGAASSPNPGAPGDTTTQGKGSSDAATNSSSSAASSGSAAAPAASSASGNVSELWNGHEINCGAHRCKVGIEVCCPGSGASAHCVRLDSWARDPAHPEQDKANPAHPDHRFALQDQLHKLYCGGIPALTCDDQGDCPRGSICCRQAVERTPDGDAVGGGYTTCVNLSDREAMGRECTESELCSDNDRSCAREGSVCRKSAEDTVGICDQKRTQPACGKRPCSEGKTCCTRDGKNPHCVAGECAEGEFAHHCRSSRHCGEDELCWRYFTGKNAFCARAFSGGGGIVSVVCEASGDCAKHCPSTTVPTCNRGTCACNNRCKQDSDCVRSCVQLGALTDGSCNLKAGACECPAE
jgi:hypothetical protein